MDRIDIGRIEHVIDEHERSLLAGTPSRKACNVLRSEIARIIDDANDRPTVPDARPEPPPSASQVRGVWESPNEAKTPVRYLPGIDRRRR